MKIFRMLGREIRDAFKSVIRNFSLSLASITCIIITLLIVSISILLSAVVNNFAKKAEKDLTIVVFLDRDIEESRIKEIEEEINLIENINTNTYKSKENVAKEIIEEEPIYETFLNGYDKGENPLQDSFVIKVKDVNKIGETADKIETILNVESVQYGEGLVEQLIEVLSAIKYVSLFILVALVIVTVFLISNTIKITIFSRRKEIEIMRLVGASNINIKIPFLFEGLFLGMFGSVIPIILTIYGYAALYEHFNGYIFNKTIELIKPLPFVYYVSLALLVIASVVGSLGSYRAVKKHLKI